MQDQHEVRRGQREESDRREQAWEGQGLVWQRQGTPRTPLQPQPLPSPFLRHLPAFLQDLQAFFLQHLPAFFLQHLPAFLQMLPPASCPSPHVLHQDSKLSKLEKLASLSLVPVNRHTLCNIKASNIYIFFKDFFR